ncbi:Gfo/Idh/MocA family oxidoreductase [Symbioplanes lichenis]|uniref:Gfo/Idh/MocA family oxidoreductase n=1 Tax=Symbioplanes lichenis TaxID=1629072 RepID=UPI00273865EF|nr:Gfo/Idh/MocA family oxidoreductase [Actinoplanes lichenis]
MINVGVIGTGMIGQDHIRRMSTLLAGVAVTAVTDVDAAVAARVAASVGARALPTGLDVIADPAVDAVLVCSWGPTHEEYVLAAVAAGKPVFCEKPLATTAAACERIIEAEVAAGRRLVQVGYMRRYDPAYRDLKAVVDSGRIGAPLMMHCAHRNAGVPAFYEKENTITDSAVHEIDMARWLFAEEIVATRVLLPRGNRNGGDLADPIFLILELAGGALVDVEVSVNIRYGYDIRGEVVGENGTASLASPTPVVIRHDGAASTPIGADWRERFARAYDLELQDWADAVARGVPTGPTAWDGYAAAVVSDASVQALRTGSRVEINLMPRPALYA